MKRLKLVFCFIELNLLNICNLVNYENIGDILGITNNIDGMEKIILNYKIFDRIKILKISHVMVYWLFSDYFRSLVGVYLFVKKFREIPHLM